MNIGLETRRQSNSHRTGESVQRTAPILATDVGNTYAFTHRYSLEGHGFGIGDVVVGDGCEQLFFVLAIERRLTGEHLEQEDTVGPPIDTLAIFLIQNDLGERQSVKITDRHGTECRKPPEQYNLETNEDQRTRRHAALILPGVPQKVDVFLSLTMPSLHIPKLDRDSVMVVQQVDSSYSAILMCPSPSNRMLSSFRSLG